MKTTKMVWKQNAYMIKFLKKKITRNEEEEIGRAIIERDYIIRYGFLNFHITRLNEIAEVYIDEDE